MTMPAERTRALRWGWELLSKLQERAGVPDELRARAAAIARAYPTPVVVKSWIEDDLPKLPEEPAKCVEAAGSLFADLQGMPSLDDELRRETLYVRRHYPQPGEAVAAARREFFFGIHSWLALEVEGVTP